MLTRLLSRFRKQDGLNMSDTQLEELQSVTRQRLVELGLLKEDTYVETQGTSGRETLGPVELVR